MRRLVTAIIVTAIAAPLLSACIIIDTNRPTTRIVHTTPADQD